MVSGKKNPWLNAYPFYHLPSTQCGQYTIRQSALAYSFSTLEAVAYSLHAIENQPPQPLLALLNAFTLQWHAYLPDKH